MTNNSEKSLLFASWHFYLDQSNGASVSMRTLLLEMVRRGWLVKTICGYAHDSRRPASLEHTLKTHYCVLKKQTRQNDRWITAFDDHGIESLVVVSDKRNVVPSGDDSSFFMHLFRNTVIRRAPRLLLTYGGYSLGGLILNEAKRLNIPSAVFLHNLAYNDVRYFRNVSRIFVPSVFASEEYRKRLGLQTLVVPPLIAPMKSSDEEASTGPEKRYVLFVNPEPGKGLGLFLGVAKDLSERRPDIRFLVVEGRQDRGSFIKKGRDILKNVRTIDYVENTEHMEEVYRLSRLTIVPSLYRETFGRVAAESMLAGVPVVASARGGLPEVVGEAGVLLDIPEDCGADSGEIPSRDVIETWIKSIVDLWDDEKLREKMRKRGYEQAQKWSFDKVADQYERTFAEL